MITTKAKGALSYLELLSKSNNIEALIPLIGARIFNCFAEKTKTATYLMISYTTRHLGCLSFQKMLFVLNI